LNRKQFEINNEQRQRLVRQFVRSHKGCNKEFVVKGLKDSLSKKTVYKVIEVMKEEGQVEELNSGKGSRGCKLFLRSDNPLVYIPLELEEFEKSFFTLFIKARERVGDSLKEKALEEVAKKYHWNVNKSSELLTTVDRSQLLSYVLSIFYRMVDSYLFRSISVWPIQIQDKIVLNKIYEIVFIKIANMLKKIAEIDEEDISPLLTSINKYTITRRLGGAGSLMEYCGFFTKYGMKGDIEAVIDSLWKIDKEIQQYAYKEPKIYRFKFKYGINGWRELLDLVEQRFDKRLSNKRSN
jgi:Fe2+ or Zn2+ uptake regulation protein